MNDFSDMVLTFTSEEMKEHDAQVRAEAFDECIEIITKLMPAEPFLRNSKHYENWRMKTTELRMLRDILEQLKERQNENKG